MEQLYSHLWIFRVIAESYHYTRQPEKIKEVQEFYNARKPAGAKNLKLTIYGPSSKLDDVIKVY